MSTERETKTLPGIDSVLEGSNPAPHKGVVRKGSGLLTEANTKNLVLGIVGGFIILLFVLVLISKKSVATKRATNVRHAKVDIGSASTKASPMIAAPADKRPIESSSSGSENVTPQSLQMTINPAAEQQRKSEEQLETVNGERSASKSASVGSASTHTQPLKNIKPFQQTAASTPWTPTPYSGTGLSQQPAPMMMSQEEKRAFNEEVTKKSITFTLSQNNQKGSTTSDGGGVIPITNLGLEEGYHIGARTESASSSASSSIPVVAAVEYNYMRDGHILIPSGSRVIGKMSLADQSGVVGFTFDSLELPDGSTIPISAVALDKNMMPIKGVVTGKNLAKQFLVATMAGLGEATAMVAGGSNMNGAYSQTDMIKEQAAMNIGNAADSQVQLLNNGQHIVVTVPAGTEINVVFIKPTATSKK